MAAGTAKDAVVKVLASFFGLDHDGFDPDGKRRTVTVSHETSRGREVVAVRGQRREDGSSVTCELRPTECVIVDDNDEFSSATVPCSLLRDLVVAALARDRGEAPAGVIATLNGDDDDDVYGDGGDEDDGVMPRKKLKEYNDRFCLLTCGRRLRIADTSKAIVQNDLKDSAAFYELMAPDVMRRVLRNGRTARVEMARAWMRHPRRRQADELAFAPGEATPIFERGGRRYLNTWSGFRVRPAPPPPPPSGRAAPSCEKLLRLVREGICGGEIEEFSYVMRWCALAVQHPGRKVETALVLVGQPGCGKGTFARAFGRLFGDEKVPGSAFVHVFNPKHFAESSFNGHMEHCKVLFVDEASFSGSRSHAGVIKGLISERSLMVERKGQDAYPAQSHLSVIVASNDSMPIPVERGDRRAALLSVQPRFAGDDEFFRELNAELGTDDSDVGGLAVFMRELQQTDVTDFDERRLPRTSGAEARRLEMLLDGECPTFHFLRDSTDELASQSLEMRQVYDSFVRSSTSSGGAIPSSRKFASRLSAVLGGGVKKHKRNGRTVLTFADAPTLQTAIASYLGVAA